MDARTRRRCATEASYRSTLASAMQTLQIFLLCLFVACSQSEPTFPDGIDNVMESVQGQQQLSLSLRLSSVLSRRVPAW